MSSESAVPGVNPEIDGPGLSLVQLLMLTPQGDLSSACAALVALGDPKDVYAAYESALGTSLLASQLKKIESGIGLPVRSRASPVHTRVGVRHVVQQRVASFSAGLYCGVTPDDMKLVAGLQAFQRILSLETLSSHMGTETTHLPGP